MLSIEQFFASKVLELEDRVQALEGYNQASALKFGNVTISSNNIIIDATGGSEQLFYTNKISSVPVSAIVFKSTGAVSDSIFRTYHSANADRVTYSTLDIYQSDLVTRDMFLQMNSTYVAGSFTGGVLNWAKHGKTGTFIVTMTDSNGLGYMTIPQNSSDPGAAGVGSIYYNTGTGKIRGKHNSGWADL